MEIWEIDRGNFRQIRLDHAINQQDIAARAHVSKSTVCHYESHNTGKIETHIEVRRDCEKMILRALVDLINEGFESTDVRGGKLMGSVAGTGMSTCPGLRKGTNKVPKKEFIFSDGDDEYSIFMNNIKHYLQDNDIRTREFCELIGANKRIFEIGFNKGKKVSDLLKKKIFDATGWTYEQILSGAINKEGDKMYIPAKKSFESDDLDIKAEAIQEYSPTAQELIDDKLDREECTKKAMAIIHKDKPIKPFVDIPDVTKAIDEQSEKLTDMIMAGASKEDFARAVEESKDILKPTVDKPKKEADPEDMTGYEYAKAIGARLQPGTTPYVHRQPEPNLYSGAQPIAPEGCTIMNKKYTYYAETDECVLSYDVVKRYSRRVSKEEFMAAIKEEKG